MFHDLTLQIGTAAAMLTFVYSVCRWQAWLQSELPEQLCQRRYATLSAGERAQLEDNVALLQPVFVKRVSTAVARGHAS